jgi:hypothetical protein
LRADDGIIAACVASGELLIERVRKLGARLSGHGWGDLFKARGLDVEAAKLRDELLKPCRADVAPVYEVLLEDGSRGPMEIGRFHHFDVRLLNYGVLIPA